MIQASIYNDDLAAVLKLPLDRYYLSYNLREIKIRDKPESIPVTGEDKNGIRVKLSSESDFGNSLIKLVKEGDTLDTINTCAFRLNNIRPEIADEMETDVLHEQFSSLEEVVEAIKQRTMELVTTTVDYYCPLTIQMTDEDGAYINEVDNSYALGNEDAIRNRLMEEQEYDLHDMADYFDRNDTAKDKIISAVWDVKEVNGVLYGVIHTYLTESLTPEEEKDWIDELTGQASDGFGEGFEQREFATEDGDMYVSFWNSNDDYFMENQYTFSQRFPDIDLQDDMSMGGM